MLATIGWIVFGAVAGVAVDRIWRTYEQRRDSRVRIRLAGGTTHDVDGNCGVHYTISNLGHSALPGYKIVLFHPLRRSLSFFEGCVSTPLLPGQHREHVGTLLSSGQPHDVTKWFWHAGFAEVEHPTGDGCVFRLMMESSDRILYQNARVGESLARIMIQSREDRTLDMMSSDDAILMQDLAE